MTPADAIAALDRAIAQNGQPIILRTGNTVTGQVTVSATVRTAKPKDNLIGGLVQGDLAVVVSPTCLASFGEPKKGQMAVIDGKAYTIIGHPELIRMGSDLVRVNMIVRGGLA